MSIQQHNETLSHQPAVCVVTVATVFLHDLPLVKQILRENISGEHLKGMYKTYR